MKSRLLVVALPFLVGLLRDTPSLIRGISVISVRPGVEEASVPVGTRSLK